MSIDLIDDSKKITIWDIAVVIAYFLIILIAGIYTMVFHKRNTIDSYFLAGRRMTWLFVGASLFASNIGSEHFIGLAGSGAASGLGVGAFELNAMIVIQILGWIFLPVFIASSVATLPEYMKKRFGGSRIRIYLSVLSLFLYIFTKISVNLYSGALFIKIALGWNLYYAVSLVLVLTALCTIGGGLAAVIYTETIQTVIMIIGGLCLMIFSYREIGSYENLYTQYMQSSPVVSSIATAASLSSNHSAIDLKSECGRPNPKAFQMLRSIDDPDMPWLGFLLGQTPASIWYWCSDQMMVQRALAAKSLSHAQGGTLFAGYIKILPLFMIVIPGMISRVLFKDKVACADPETCMKWCDSPNGCSNIAYPILIMELMPVGLKGLMMAVMLSALMSDLTSIFNSSATLFTVDVYKQFRRNASNKELMIIGRLFVIFMVAIGIVWIPIIKNMQGAQLYIYIQSVAAYLSPPIAAVYLLAVLWKRANEEGAFWSLMIGMVVGIIRMILDFIFTEPPCGDEDTRPDFIKKFHYMYFAVLLFWQTIIIMAVVSWATEKPEPYKLIRTTYWTRKQSDKRPDESDDFREKSSDSANDPMINEFELNSRSTKNIVDEVDIKDTMNNSSCETVSNTLVSLFCGFEPETNENIDRVAADATAQQKDEAKRRIESFRSLNQTPREKFILNFNLVLILIISVGLYVFFSIPPENHVLRNVVANKSFNLSSSV